MSTFDKSVNLARENSFFYNALLEKKDIVDNETLLAIASHAIHTQAAKIQVIANSSMISTSLWTREMVQGLNKALYRGGYKIVSKKRKELKEPNQSQFFKEQYLENQKNDRSMVALRKLKAELSTQSEENLFFNIEQALNTQALQDEVAKITVLIRDFIDLKEQKADLTDALSGLNFALQVGNYKIIEREKTALDLFVDLCHTHSTKQKKATYNADQDSKLQQQLIEVIEDVLADTIKENGLIQIEALEQVKDQYDPNVIAYVEKLFLENPQTDPFTVLQKHIDKYTKIASNRTAVQLELIGLLTDLLNEYAEALIQESDKKEDEVSHYSLAAEVVQKEVNQAIKNHTIKGFFGLASFTSSGIENKLLSQYIQTLALLQGSAKINADRLKEMARKHLEKVQRLAKEKDKEVQEKRRHQKEDDIREEREREKVKRRASKEKSKKEGSIF